MRMALVVASAVVVAVVAAGCGDGEATAPPVQGDAAAGSIPYREYCAGCHGEDGRGAAAGPGLLDARYALPGFDDQALVTAIVEGAPEREWDFGPMPRIRGLGQQELADLVAFVRELQRGAGIG
jgi:mono/diheme cytochrome c family protein